MNIKEFLISRKHTDAIHGLGYHDNSFGLTGSALLKNKEAISNLEEFAHVETINIPERTGNPKAFVLDTFYCYTPNNKGKFNSTVDIYSLFIDGNNVIAMGDENAFKYNQK